MDALRQRSHVGSVGLAMAAVGGLRPAPAAEPVPVRARPLRAAPGAAAIALLAFLVPGRAAADERFVGTARHPDGRVAYVEEHRVRREGERVVAAETRYLDPAGRPVARLVSDYGRDPFAPDYRYEDLRTGEVEEVALRDGGLELRAGERRRLLPLDRRRPLAAGQGLDRLTRARLTELARGEVLRVSLALPSRLEAYDFRIRALPVGPGGPLRVRIEPASFLLRLLAPSIEADYERETGRLVAYRGVSNVAGPRGEVQQVEIEYRYPGAGDGA